MSSRLATVLGLGAVTLLAAGCTPVDYGLGEAAKYNAAVQTVNPDPVYAPGSAQPGASGERAVLASDRYRKGTVKEPVSQTSSGGGSSLGGGGR